LTALESAYAGIYTWELIVQEAERNGFHPFRRRPSLGHYPADATRIIAPEDRLLLAQIHVASPGWLSIFGKESVLEVIRKYLRDRHERRQDRAYREPAERERLRLDNMRRRLEVQRLAWEMVKDQAEMLRRHGVPEADIREALVEYIAEPLERIEEHVDAGIIDVDASQHLPL